MKKIFIFFSLSFLIFFGIVNATIKVQAFTESTHNVTITTVVDEAADIDVVLENKHYGELITPFASTAAPEGHEFAFWIVNGVVKKDLLSNHEFPVTSDLVITGVFEPSNKHAVLFIDSNGMKIHHEFVLDGDEVTEPSTEGFTKPHYIVADTPWKEVNGNAANFSNINESKVFVLQYKLDGSVDPVTITVNGESEEYAYNQVVTLTADNPEFTHWEEEGVVVSYNPTYTFTALVDRTIEEKTNGTTNQPLVILNNVSGIREGYKSFLGQVYLPLGYELLETGILASNEEEVLFLDTPGVEVIQSNSILDTTNEFLRSFPEESFSTFRAYAVVQNSEGIETVYSENNYYQLPDLPLEQVFYETGFESNEGFESSTNYQAGMVKNGWIVVNGTVTETAASADDLHLQMRLYSSGTITATYHNEQIEYDISKVEFFVDGSNGASTIKVQFSEDGNIWSTGVDISLGSSNPKSVNSDIPNTKYVRWTTSDINPSSNNKRYNLDDVKIYGLIDGEPSQEYNIIKLYNVELVNGEASTNVAVHLGNTIQEPTSPTKTGYTFVGWFTENDEEFDFETEITSHLKLYAKFLPIPKYTVTFNLNGGIGSIDNQLVYENNNAIKPETDPTNGELIFIGWFTDIEEGVLFDFNNTPITDNITLYAHWSSNAVTHTVSFNVDGGTEIDEQQIIDGMLAIKPADNPTKANYVFAGWYTSVDFSTEFDFNNPITSDTIIYVQFAPIIVLESGTFTGRNSLPSGWSHSGLGSDYTSGNPALKFDTTDDSLTTPNFTLYTNANVTVFYRNNGISGSKVEFFNQNNELIYSTNEFVNQNNNGNITFNIDKSTTYIKMVYIKSSGNLGVGSFKIEHIPG